MGSNDRVIANASEGEFEEQSVMVGAGGWTNKRFVTIAVGGTYIQPGVDDLYVVGTAMRDELAGAFAMYDTSSLQTVAADAPLTARDPLKVGTLGRVTKWNASAVTVDASVTGAATSVTQPGVATLLAVLQATDQAADRGKTVRIVGSNAGGVAIYEDIALDADDTTTVVAGAVSFTQVAGAWLLDGTNAAANITVEESDTTDVCVITTGNGEISCEVPASAVETYCSEVTITGPNGDGTYITIFGVTSADVVGGERLTMDGANPSVATTTAKFRQVTAIMTGEATNAGAWVDCQTVPDTGDMYVGFVVEAVTTHDDDALAVLDKGSGDNAVIVANTADIVTNASDIAVNTSDIAANATDILTNASDIAVNVTAAAANASDIVVNASDIAVNVTAAAANASDIVVNASDIAVNVTAAATNASDIVVNASDIAVNVTAAATNASDIVVNASDITVNTASVAALISQITATGTIHAKRLVAVNAGTFIEAIIDDEDVVGVAPAEIAGAGTGNLNSSHLLTVEASAPLTGNDTVKVGDNGRVTMWNAGQVTIDASAAGQTTAFTQPGVATTMEIRQAGDVVGDRSRDVRIVGSNGAGAAIYEDITLDASNTTTVVAGSTSFTTISGAFMVDGSVTGAQNILVQEADDTLVCTIAGASLGIGMEVPGTGLQTYCQEITASQAAGGDVTYVTYFGLLASTGALGGERKVLDGATPSVFTTTAQFLTVTNILLGEFTNAATISSKTNSTPDTNDQRIGKVTATVAARDDDAVLIFKPNIGF